MPAGVPSGVGVDDDVLGDTNDLHRNVSSLLTWLEAAPPGTLIPATELAERLRSLPTVRSIAVAAVDHPAKELEPLVKADYVAEWLSCDRQRVYRMARDGRLPAVRIGGNTIRFRRSDVERWLEIRCR